MQLAPAERDEILKCYIGGDIIICAHSNGSSLVRGSLLAAEVKGDWAFIRLTCREYAVGDLESIDDAIWHQSSNQPTAVLLKAEILVTDEGILSFPEKTPQGTMAIVALPEFTQSSVAA